MKPIEQPYMKKVRELMMFIDPGTVVHVDVKHDKWCKIYAGKMCNCNFEVKIRSDA